MRGVRGVPPAPGVYSIHWLKDDKFVPIHRLAGIDGKGVLYIGSSRNLRSRLRRLASVLRNLYGGGYTRLKHTFARSLAYTGNRERVGPSELCVCFKAFSTEEESRYYEALALYEYSSRHGEPPPLNLSLHRGVIAVFNPPESVKTRPPSELDRDLKEILGLR